MNPFMTEEEKWRAALLRGQASPVGQSGMSSPYMAPAADYATANQDFTSQENNIAAQRAMANQLRGSELPQGREVGPSGIYVGPNWGETVDHLAKQLTGGYMAGQANKAEDAVGLQRQGRADALARIAAADAAEKQRATGFSENMDIRTIEGQEADREAQSARQAEQDRRADANLGISIAQEARNADRTTTTVEVDVATGDVYTIETDATGNRRSKDGRDIEGLHLVDWNQYEDNLRLRDAADAKASGAGMDKKVEKLDQRVVSYGKEVQKGNVPALSTRVTQLQGMMDKLPLRPDGFKDIPGTGGLQNTITLGGILTKGEEILSPEDQWNGVSPTNFRAARQGLNSDLLKAMSGAAVTLPEQLRNQVAQAMEWSSNDKDFETRWPDIIEITNAVDAHFRAVYGPEVIDLYEARKENGDLTTREFLEGREKGEASLEDLTEEELDALLAEEERKASGN